MHLYDEEQGSRKLYHQVPTGFEKEDEDCSQQIGGPNGDQPLAKGKERRGG